MKNDYLWGSGAPDPELQRIEKSLSQFRYSREMPDFLSIGFAQPKPSFLSPMTTGWPLRLAAATALLVALAVSGLLLRVSPPRISERPGWDVARVSGTPRVGYLSLIGNSNKAQLKVGQLLVTDAASRAALNVGEIGEVYLDPGTRVRLIETGASRERLALELGTIHAAIWAPPGKFVVDTPSATAVDLGCAYTLQVNGDGSGMLRTTLGWVGFHNDGHDSFIPAGAMCMTRPKHGPGTPYFEDASQELRSALLTFDFESESAGVRETALRTILTQARPRDAFTLWHLLFRVNDQQRSQVYDRLVSLVPQPADVTREGTLSLNPRMLDVWWNALDLGEISTWRFWEQHQAPPTTKEAAR
jgi:FecR protein